MFNVGVEIGQLAFVAMILLLVRAFKVIDMHWPRWVEWAPAHLVGSLGAVWTAQRVALIFSGGWIMRSNAIRSALALPFFSLPTLALRAVGGAISMGGVFFLSQAFA